MKKRNVLLAVALYAGLIFVASEQSASAQYSINSGQSCGRRGQIRDFQAQRFVCLKVNSKGGSSSGPSLVWVKISSPKSTTKPTSTTTAETTTSLPRICQEGSVCKVGDQGPGGGLVFYVNQDKTSTGWKYLELAPTSVTSTWSGASAAADAYKTVTKDDWFLPTNAQLILAIENLFFLPNPPLFFNECLQGRLRCISIWTSDSDGTGRGIYGGPRMTQNKLSSDNTKVDPRSMSPSPAHAGVPIAVFAIRGEKITSTSTPASTSAPSSDTVGLDPFPSRPMGRTFIWRNSMLEPHQWELAINRYFDAGARPDTYLSLFFPSGDSFGSCTDPASYVRFNISFAHDVPGGSSAIYQGQEGSVERCSYSGINVVAISSSRYGSRFFGAGGNSFLNDFPKSNREKDTPVVFWVRVIGEHPHIGFRTDSGWIKVDLRKWLDK